MERQLNDKEFELYLKQTFNEFVCRLERNPVTDNGLFEQSLEKLIEIWEKSFYRVVNKRFFLFYLKGIKIVRVIVAEAIVRQWLKDKENASVEYVNNRVEILKEDLSELCSEILDKYYV